jgi:tyrosyl-tRNA synthetase
MPLLEGTDGVQKMSKSLGNYIGINEAPQEMFGKVMSISDELMWRYYELLTDLSAEEIASLQASAEAGERNPRDIKVELAKRIIMDFHSAAEANAAEEDFRRKFVLKEIPQEIEERAAASGEWKLPRLMVATGLASSVAEARRLIEQGGVKVEGERRRIKELDISLSEGHSILLQVGKRHFLRVRGIAEKLERQAVSSANLASVGYCRDTRTLEIEFRNGVIYRYYDIPQEEFDNLMKADSHGQHFDANIKKGAYNYIKVD